MLLDDLLYSYVEHKLRLTVVEHKPIRDGGRLYLCHLSRCITA